VGLCASRSNVKTLGCPSVRLSVCNVVIGLVASEVIKRIVSLEWCISSSFITGRALCFAGGKLTSPQKETDRQKGVQCVVMKKLGNALNPVA